MSKFQIALLFVFGFFIVVAVGVFSLYRGGSSNQAAVTVWGSLPSASLNALLGDPVFTADRTVTIHYVEKPASTLESDFTEALAQGDGPDLIILSQDELWQARNKLTPIPYGSVSERDFRDAFADGSEIFLSPSGIYALPLMIDPLVLYYNRDILSGTGFAKPLSYWDEIYAAASKLTTKDAAGNLTRSTIALGEWRNIPRAKDILSLLLLQAGTPITAVNGTVLNSVLSDNMSLPVAPAEAALDFYTQFANPSKPFYSWNRTLPDAPTHFAAGDSAYYLGFASELSLLRGKSPTLNVGVANVPQSRVSGKSITFGRIYGIALSKGTKNAPAALAAATKLVSAPSAVILSKSLVLPPARRDLLSAKPTDAVGPVFYDSALMAHSWLDPDPVETKSIFQDAIESVTSGRARTSEAVSAANSRLNDATKK